MRYGCLGDVNFFSQIVHDDRQIGVSCRWGDGRCGNVCGYDRGDNFIVVVATYCYCLVMMVIFP